MIDNIKVKGRHIGTHPTKAAALRVTECYPLGDRLLVRLDDDNYDDFWAEVTIPLADLKKLLDQTGDPLPSTDEQAEERLRRDQSDDGCVYRYHYRRQAGRSVARAYVEQFVELKGFKPLLGTGAFERFYWTCLAEDMRSAAGRPNDLPPWLFELFKTRPLPEGASLHRASISYPTAVAAFDHMSAVFESLDDNPPSRPAEREGSRTAVTEETGATASNA